MRRVADVADAAGDMVKPARRVFALLASAVLVLIVMNEISKIVGDVAVTGRTHAASSAFAPFVGVNALIETFGDWSAYVRDTLPAMQGWLFLYLSLDFVFIALYVLISIGAYRRSQQWVTTPDPTSGTGGRPGPSPVRGWSVLWWGVPVIGVIDIVEDVFGMLLIGQLPNSAGVFASPSPGMWILLIGLMLATWLKWLAVLTVLVSTVYQMFTLNSVTPPRWVSAVKIQRFSLVVVALLAVFMVAPAGDIFDQVADVERSWITWPSFWQAVFAVLVFGLLGVSLRHLGGLRATRAGLAFTGDTITRGTTEPKPSPAATENGAAKDRGWRWLWIPAALVGGAVLLSWLSWAHVSWLAVIGASTVPIAVVIGNAIVIHADLNPTRRFRLLDPGVTPYVWLIGDLLAVAVVWLLGLSAVRAFTALVLLDVDRVPALVAVLIGAVVAIGVWPLAWTPIRTRFRNSQAKHPVKLAIDPPADCQPATQTATDQAGESVIGTGLGQPTATATTTKPDKSGDRPRPWFDVTNPWVRRIAYLAFAVGTAVLVLFPRLVGGLGPVATIAACLTVIALGLIAVAVAVQWRQPLRLFQAVGLDTTPALTLIAIAGLLVATVFDRSPDVHISRAPVPVAADQQTPLETWQATTFADSVQMWLDDDQTHSCGIDLATRTPDGRPIRAMPMVLIGAAGGGIRAAWWTVNTLDTLAKDPCGRHAVLAVSSVSGSSLGMALMLTSSDPVGDTAKLGDAAPLSEAVDGLLVGDVFSSITGLKIDIPGNNHDPFPDRAALLEQAWEQAAGSLSTPFPAPPTTSTDTSGTTELAAHVPWRTFFNATSARTGCRVVISDVTTQPTNSTAPRESPDCELATGDSGVAGSYNLFAAQPCLAGIHTSTAALLSARFPYVLPSGLVDAPPCAADTSNGNIDVSDQLIDGGYAENSGLGTLDDLAGQYMPLVRAHNAQQLTQSGTGPVTVVVPIIISLDNSPQVPATGPTPNPPVAETLVPVMSGLLRGATLENTASLLERIQNQTADWLPCTAPGHCSDPAAAIEKAVSARFGTRGIEVAPGSAPRIAAPLGWAMSAASRDAMTTALNDLLHNCHSNCEFTDLVNGLQAGEQPR